MATEAEAMRVAEQSVEAFNRGDWDLTRRLYTDDAVYDELATGRRAESSEEMIMVLQSWREAFPDARGTVTNAFPSGDQVALEVTWEGTQSGYLHTPQGNLPPSNRLVTIYAAQMLTLEGGRIKENRHYFDMLRVLQETGAVG